jgi:hypothetical protein
MNVNDFNFNKLQNIFIDKYAQNQIKEIYPVLLELDIVMEFSNQEIEGYKKQMTHSFEFHKEKMARDIIENNIVANIEICIEVLNYLNDLGIHGNYSIQKNLLQLKFVESA